MAPRKLDLALKVKDYATQLADLLDGLEALVSIYSASGYGSGGADPIVDADLTGHAITVAQITQFGGLVTNLLKLMGNQTPTIGKYREQLDAFRNIS